VYSDLYGIYIWLAREFDDGVKGDELQLEVLFSVFPIKIKVFKLYVEKRLNCPKLSI